MTSDNPPTPTDGDDFSTGEVRVALERVLASERFVASARISTFLRFIVDETLEGRGSGIKAYRIATRAFGFSDTFDPQSDPYIRILARRLRRALTYYYQKEGRGDPLRIDVPKGGYVPRFQERSGDEAHAGGSPPASVEDPHQPARPAVAIVMFLDLTETEAWAHLATGLTEEVLVNLTRFSEFRVIGPLWSDRLEEGNAALGGIRARFHTDFAVYGSVHALGEGVEISVRLQDTRDATSLWAETYELDPGGAHLVELEHEITGQIATTIADSTGVIARTLISESRGQAVEALTGYEAVLRGYHWATVLTDDAYREARRALEHAVEESPSYAPAKAILSDLYFSDYLSAIDPAPGSLDRAERLAEEAVRLDPVCHDARWTLGQVHFARRRPERFVQEFEAAIALNPWKASTLASYALFLSGLEQWERAADLIETAIRLSPHHPAWFHMVPYLKRYHEEDFDGALEEAARVVTPDLIWGPVARAAALGRLGRLEEARYEYEDVLARQPEFEVRARKLLGRLLCSDGILEAVLGGLNAAGLPASTEDEAEGSVRLAR